MFYQERGKEQETPPPRGALTPSHMKPVADELHVSRITLSLKPRVGVIFGFPRGTNAIELAASSRDHDGGHPLTC